MTDFLAVAIKVQRIEVLTRTLVNDLYSGEDRELVEIWLAELATNVAEEVKASLKVAKSPTQGH